MVYYTSHCPSCRALVDLYVICSGLGPATVRCRKCGKRCATERSEWNDLSAAGRARYVAVSLVHACSLGFLGAITASLAAYGIEHGPTSTVPRSAFFGGTLYAGAAFYVGLVVWVQLARVRGSKLRAARGAKKEPIVARLTSLDLGLQLKLLALIWVPVIVGDIIGLIRA